MQKSSYENLPAKLKLIFLAGLFDGEGSFGLWGNGKAQNGKKRKQFQCGVEMRDKDILIRFSNFFGGNIRKCRIRNPKHNQLWRWRLSGTRAYECMDMMIEYMCQRRQEKYNVVQCTKTRIERGNAHL